MDEKPETIFIPKEKVGRQLFELDFKFVSELIYDDYSMNIVLFKDQNNNEYPINLSNDRYILFKKQNFTCTCCRLIANRSFVEKEEKSNYYQVNFYAENYDANKNRNFLILFEKDHIKPRSKGGIDCFENYQTLCVNCNYLKRNLDLTVDDMRAMLFPAYRAYKASLSVSEAKEKTKKIRKIAQGHLETSRKLRKIYFETDDLSKKELLLKKADFLESRSLDVLEECSKFELQAQITGTCPDSFGITKTHFRYEE